MKINQGLRVGRELPSLPREKPAVDGGAFRQLVKNQQQKLNTEQLNRLMTEIDRQGERLAEHRTVEELRAYKELVRKFVKEAVSHGVALEDTSGFPFRGKERRYKVLKELDQQLINVTNEVLDEQEKQIDILARIGEIKGLLLNLYF